MYEQSIACHKHAWPLLTSVMYEQPVFSVSEVASLQKSNMI